jgi:hypothetical protein
MSLRGLKEDTIPPSASAYWGMKEKPVASPGYEAEVKEC